MKFLSWENIKNEPGTSLPGKVWGVLGGPSLGWGGAVWPLREPARAVEPVQSSDVLMGVGASLCMLLPPGLFNPLPWLLQEPPLAVGESHSPISTCQGGSQGKLPGRGARKARAASRSSLSASRLLKRLP